MKYERRLRKLASRAGLCHVHMTPLVCITCEARRGSPSWAGTQAELEELCALDDRCDPYRDEIPAAGVCPLFRCGGKLFCEPCYNAASARIVFPDNLYSPEEVARYAELMGMLCVKDAPGRSPDIASASKAGDFHQTSARTHSDVPSDLMGCEGVVTRRGQDSPMFVESAADYSDDTRGGSGLPRRTEDPWRTHRNCIDSIVVLSAMRT